MAKTLVLEVGGGSTGGDASSQRSGGGGEGGEAPPPASTVIGYASLSVTQPAALLPPPFPSSAPHGLYLDALAVDPSRRRAGAGRALLRACCDVGRRWGARGLWLRARCGNYAALALYRSEGFRTVAVVGPPWRRENLMRKELPARRRAGPPSAATAAAAAPAAAGGPASRRAGDGGAARGEGSAVARRSRVYVWGAQEEE
ncbi:hypothetical protein MNEG_11495 [Monoraphidium neglectum]|uniref:N-acetyltransferase domain-containing protein n=1 Tax=Monoraphidium neglectum TaxID=145388 RepID=A0A0D2KL19_9CHLO|nr:hypothetical protein MNEG_11495 [Monoraphidium neglectum]KIY96468.1 hypothetical protein MNEG_11495 [Monoraphidium neglectum]|eukprot:XP_013895488.1 hypothetical protein MNEG_11495 [Monoraphidium neglectum]